jgi:hypothetical protein
MLLLTSFLEEASTAVHLSPKRIIVLRIQAIVVAARNVTICDFVFLNIRRFVAIDPQIANKDQILHNGSNLLLFTCIIIDPDVAAENYIPHNGGITVASGHKIPAIDGSLHNGGIFNIYHLEVTLYQTAQHVEILRVPKLGPFP